MVDDCCLTTTRQVIATFHRVKPEVARDQDTWRDVTEAPIVLRILHLTPPLAEWSVLVSSNTDHWPGGVGALDRSTIIHRHLRYVTGGSFCFRSLVVSLIHTTLDFGIISPWSGYLLTCRHASSLCLDCGMGRYGYLRSYPAHQLQYKYKYK